MIYYFIALIVFLLDQGTKWIIATQMRLGEQRSVIGDFFLITSHRNTGAAFSILEGQRWFFLVITPIVLIGIVWYMQKMKQSGSKMLFLGLSLILGGAVGNFLDRVLTGEVVDFLQFNFGNYTFPIFNIADSGIVIGVGLVLLDSLLGAKKGENNQKSEELQ
ncbi:Lipoprotein signal peptidase [Paenibacillus sp. CECT 9249]|uniref:signal peptidase II n=1 Tax=Paenibacillus sp. CECT 9249 TaxID=2845385 RepID=UPI001E6151C5|nr:signal peptidase II [Paenibacillus sp. CECT 9249]CAH0122518.1 Lipoprotein signal peptidase [Paenibacillus sp. CECT 9249]